MQAVDESVMTFIAGLFPMSSRAPTETFTGFRPAIFPHKPVIQELSRLFVNKFDATMGTHRGYLQLLLQPPRALQRLLFLLEFSAL